MQQGRHYGFPGHEMPAAGVVAELCRWAEVPGHPPCHEPARGPLGDSPLLTHCAETSYSLEPSRQICGNCPDGSPWERRHPCLHPSVRKVSRPLAIGYRKGARADWRALRQPRRQARMPALPGKPQRQAGTLPAGPAVGGRSQGNSPRQGRMPALPGKPAEAGRDACDLRGNRQPSRSRANNRKSRSRRTGTGWFLDIAKALFHKDLAGPSRTGRMCRPPVGVTRPPGHPPITAAADSRRCGRFQAAPRQISRNKGLTRPHEALYLSRQAGVRPTNGSRGRTRSYLHRRI